MPSKLAWAREMLLPTQIAASTAITDSMQSMIDTIEDRRRKEQEEKSGQKTDPMLKARIGASEETRRAQGRIAEALFGVNKVDINELKIELMDKLGEKVGITREDGMSSYGYGRAIEGALKNISSGELNDITKELGLGELDMTLDALVAAIKAPWGEENDKLEKALERKAGGGESTTDQEKVLQRLDDVSDPKTLEELKLGPQYSDPTRVVDEETKLERQEDIEAREAGAKLEDVQDMQDAIEDRNEAASADQPLADAQSASDDLLLTTLAAAADQSGEPSDDEQAVVPDGDPLEADKDGALPAVGSGELLSETGNESVQVTATIGDEALTAQVSVDEIGVYDVLRRNREDNTVVAKWPDRPH